MKTLFVHIPKTAGSSVSHALSCWKTPWEVPVRRMRVSFRHLLPSHYPEGIDSWAQDALKITFVRDPYDRAVSIYTFKTGGKVPFLKYLQFIEEKLDSAGYHKQGEGFVHSPQTYWLEGVDYDFMGRFERLKDDVSRAQDLSYAPTSRLPHSVKSKRRPTEEYYDDVGAVDIVQRVYRKDFELLGYPM